MSARQRLSRGEWNLMNICWRLGKATARQIFEESLRDQERDYQTIKTILDRIASKGFLRVEKLGPLCLYSPAVKRTTAVAQAVDDFVSTVLDDSLAPLFMHLIQSGEMSRKEIEEITAMLEKKSGKDE